MHATSVSPRRVLAPHSHAHLVVRTPAPLLFYPDEQTKNERNVSSHQWQARVCACHADRPPATPRCRGGGNCEAFTRRCRKRREEAQRTCQRSTCVFVAMSGVLGRFLLALRHVVYLLSCKRTHPSSTSHHPSPHAQPPSRSHPLPASFYSLLASPVRAG